VGCCRPPPPFPWESAIGNGESIRQSAPSHPTPISSKAGNRPPHSPFPIPTIPHSRLPIPKGGVTGGADCRFPRAGWGGGAWTVPLLPASRLSPGISALEKPRQILPEVLHGCVVDVHHVPRREVPRLDVGAGGRRDREVVQHVLHREVRRRRVVVAHGDEQLHVRILREGALERG